MQLVARASPVWHVQHRLTTLPAGPGGCVGFVETTLGSSRSLSTNRRLQPDTAGPQAPWEFCVQDLSLQSCLPNESQQAGLGISKGLCDREPGSPRCMCLLPESLRMKEDADSSGSVTWHHGHFYDFLCGHFLNSGSKGSCLMQ